MKTKYPSMFGLLVALMLVASFVVPTNFMSPKPVEADPGICKWDTLMTPGYLPLKNDLGVYDPHDMAIGGDGATVLISARYFLAPLVPTAPSTGVVSNFLFYSNNNGISFTGTKYTAFATDFWDLNGIAYPNTPAGQWPNVYQVAIAPDNPNFWAIVTDPNTATDPLTYTPQEVWVTSNAGSSWDCTNLGLTGTETVRTIDISVDYGGRRDIAVGTVTAAGGEIYVIKSVGFTGWIAQNIATTLGAAFNVYAIKFSPTYASDAALAAVYANGSNTYYNIGLRDIDKNNMNNWAWGATDVEVRDPTWGGGASPSWTCLNKADLELPSDFSGQAASLRRAYISLDAHTASTGAAPGTSDCRDGIFRVDDTTVYTLMDTSTVNYKAIYSIAYFGTYASGKLLAGERWGYHCTATVPTWFTDSPTTCPIPCWYPALKPTTGAAGISALSAISCAPGVRANGAGMVGWRADGQLAFAATGFTPVVAGAAWYGSSTSGWINTTAGYYYGLFPYDESAFAISRNNGETWNQIALIDTATSASKGGSWGSEMWLTDIAPTPDCKTVYLASTSYVPTYPCASFDSVWRTSSNTEVVSPYPALPLGIFWERVLCRPTSLSCNQTQTDVALLRIVPYCQDPSGQIVGWAAWDTKAQMWSPDYGDYWATITPRDKIQDFCFESKTVLYNLSPDGPVQKMPYTGTAWSTTLASVDPIIYGAHTIAAYPEGKVLVGAAAAYHASLYAVSYSSNFNTDNPSFTVQSFAGRTPYYGDVHVAFHPNFKENNLYFINDAGTSGGSVYRNNPTAQRRWVDTDMMDATNGAVGCDAPHQEAQYGLWISYSGETLYSAHDVISDNTSAGYGNSGVCRTLDLLEGMPKPGMAWDCLIVGLDKAPLSVAFTLEPTSLKACGCCTLETDTTLYAIDDARYIPFSRVAMPGTLLTNYDAVTQAGLVWGFTDCVAKKGPALVTADKSLIGCDPVSGRAQEVNLCWEQLCVADGYDIEISKNADFSIRIIDWVKDSSCNYFEPVDVLKPCAFFPAGGLAVGISGGITSGPVASAIAAWGNLECGHTYYWRVKVRHCATGQYITSPWSDVRSFTVKAGLPVTTPYYGPQLLAPNNGCLGCPVKPASFSWSPFKETTKYKFQLAKDAAMTQIVKEAEVTTTAFEYDGTLDYSSNYFWRIMSLEPAPSDWSATFSFQTEAAPAPAAPPEKPAPTPFWVWVVIAIGAILVIVTLVLIFKTRRV